MKPSTPRTPGLPTGTPRLLLAACAIVAGLGLGGCAYSPGVTINTNVRQDVPPADPPPPGALLRITPELVRALRAVPEADPSKDLQPFLADAQPYRIGPADVLAIVVWGAPDFSSPAGSVNSSGGSGGTAGSGGFVVSAEGFIQVPFLGAVKAAGLTEDELRIRLNEQLQPLFKRPQVTVSVQSYRSGRIYVDGEVRTPGQQVINDVPMTLPEAISRAGGLTNAADRSAVVITRGVSSVRVNLDTLTARGINPQRILLARGDTVRVTSNEETRVYVLGEVTSPGPKPLRKGRLSLNEALGDAAGVSSISGDPRQIYVVRASDPLKPEIFHLDASTPAAMALAEGFELKPRDVVYVDPVPLVRWNRVISLILPSAAAVTVTRDAAGLRN
jgi:polysaccharide export outer membrane protein